MDSSLTIICLLIICVYNYLCNVKHGKRLTKVETTLDEAAKAATVSGDVNA